MDVKFKSKIEQIPPNSTPVQKRPHKAAPLADSVRLDQSARLDKSLAATPEVRAEAVERARKLISDTAFPSKETLSKVAAVLAANIKGAQ